MTVMTSSRNMSLCNPAGPLYSVEYTKACKVSGVVCVCIYMSVFTYECVIFVCLSLVPNM